MKPYLRFLIALAVVVSVLLLACAASAIAPTISLDQAHRVADNWLNIFISEKGSWGDASSANLQPVRYIVDARDTLGYYFEIAPTGYILCPSSSELPPITAYSTTDHLVFDDTNSFGSLLRDILKEKIHMVDGLKADLRRYAQAGLDTSEVKTCRASWRPLLQDYAEFSKEVRSISNSPIDDVDPLLQAEWHQEVPYNYFCPIGFRGYSCLVGCVATAAAQIMKYYNWPPTGTGNPTYWWNGDQNVHGRQLTDDCNDPYDWANMLDSYSGEYTTVQRDAVAELCHEIGVAFEMDYHANYFHSPGSLAYTSDAPIVYRTYFRYNDQMLAEYRGGYSSGQLWFNMICAELNAGRPMQYDILHHSIVCDGWRVFLSSWNQVHMNYGWADGYNTWYTVDHLYQPGQNPGTWRNHFLIRNISPEPTPDAPVTLTPLNPPIQIPSSGGSFDFTMSFANNEPHWLTLHYWTLITKPDGSIWGPILEPTYLTLSRGQISSDNHNQVISASDPPGTYTYTAYVGHYEETNPEVWSSDNFQFVKQEATQPGGTELWVARYNGPGNGSDQAYDLVSDANGNVFVTGGSGDSGTSSDYTTIKYDASGNQIWVARYNGPGNYNDVASSLAIDGDGNVYVTGYSAQTGIYPYNYDYATIKYNSAGVEQWVARYSGPGNGYDDATSVALDGNGNVYVTGGSAGIGTYTDYATIKYNAAGQQQWVARYNGPGNDYDAAYSLTLDGSGNVYLTGYSYGNGTYNDYATIMYNSAGIQLWVTRYNDSANGNYEARSIAVEEGGGNIYVTGSCLGSGNSDDYATIKYNSAGVQQWVAFYNGTLSTGDNAHALVVDGGGNVYVTGWSTGTGYPFNCDYATVKYNSAGVQQWVARYNSPANGNDYGYSLALDGDGNVYVTGYSAQTETYFNDDYATIKYNAAGQQQWVALYNGPGNDYDAACSLALDGSGNVYVTGYSVGNGTGDDYATIKYSGGNIAGWGEPVATMLGGAPVKEFTLNQNYPNPFNPTTTLHYELPAASQVTLKVYDTSGRLVTTLVNGYRQAGAHEVTFDGSRLASGVYLVRLEAGEFRAVQKMVLLK
ncbi:MAG: C10 family peptidase [bacterium]|nr:C10 family peptidase [bacterium]